MEKAIRKVCVEMPEEAAQNKKKNTSAAGVAKKVKKEDVDFLVSTRRYVRCCSANQTEVTDRSTRCIGLLLTPCSTRSCYFHGHRLNPLCKKPMETWAQLSRRS